jgi:hypothetical protein
MNARKVIFYWNQMVHIIGNINTIQQPDTFHLAAEALAELAEGFLSSQLDSHRRLVHLCHENAAIGEGHASLI